MSTIEPQIDPWDNPNHIKYHTMPVRYDSAYLHYSDLNEFIKGFGTDQQIKILDYGAGASPYRKYFPRADYKRADITGSPKLDYRLNSDSTVPEKDESFDLVISTQVAEHVSNPDIYFKECFRLLRRGGRLILTTHGIWEEHASPYDFQRWTEAGLKRDLKAAGFLKPALYKLTCGMRAGVLFFTRALFEQEPPSKVLYRLMFKTFRYLYSKSFTILHLLCDIFFSSERIVLVKDSDVGPTFYIVIATIAEKS